METKLNGTELEIILVDNLVASNLENQEAAIREFINTDNIEHVKLNMENVTEIDSLGINLIVGVYKELTKKEIKFSTINTNSQIKNLFSMFKLSSYFDVA
jgi:anti-anti-sigma factor